MYKYKDTLVHTGYEFKQQIYNIAYSENVQPWSAQTSSRVPHYYRHKYD